MQIVVLNGVLSEREQKQYVDYIFQKYPNQVFEKIYLTVNGEYVDIQYVPSSYRSLAKMGGYYVGDPSTWNHAKRAEFSDALPNISLKNDFATVQGTAQAMDGSFS